MGFGPLCLCPSVELRRRGSKPRAQEAAWSAFQVPADGAALRSCPPVRSSCLPLGRPRCSLCACERSQDGFGETSTPKWFRSNCGVSTRGNTQVNSKGPRQAGEKFLQVKEKRGGEKTNVAAGNLAPSHMAGGGDGRKKCTLRPSMYRVLP